MFRFRLQKVLDLRERLEQEKARGLVAAEEVATQARDTRDTLRVLKNTSRAELSAAHDVQPRVGHLQQLGMVLSSLEERLDLADQKVSEAEEGVHAARCELELAARDRQMLDRLKDRHETEFRLTERHRDRVEMDEVAISRFARKGGRNGHVDSQSHSQAPGSAKQGERELR